MEAASEVRALPMVEMSCPVQSSEKLRLRKTANAEVEAGLDVIMKMSPVYFPSGFVFAAQASRTVFTWKGVKAGCLARISAVIPVIWGAAKLFPVQTKY